MKHFSMPIFLLIAALLAGSLNASVKAPVRHVAPTKNDPHIVLRAHIEKYTVGKWTPDMLDKVADILRYRVENLGGSKQDVRAVQPDKIVVNLPPSTNREQAIAVLLSKASMEFRYVPQLESKWSFIPEEIDGKSTGFEVITSNANGRAVSPGLLEQLVFSKKPLLSGADLKLNARAEIDQRFQLIHFEFQDNAKRTFEDFTREHIGKRLAIFLDHRLISAPTINGAIPGKGIIEGNFTPDAARTLADQLNAGALPVPLALSK